MIKEKLLSTKIKKKILKLDLILLLDNEYLKYFRIKKYPKNGIWTVNYASKQNEFAGFWESYLSKGTSNVILKKICLIKNIFVMWATIVLKLAHGF